MNVGSELFVGEDRNIQLKTVTFFCIDQRTGKMLWKDIELEEKWWVGIESIQGKVVFFHGFAKPDMPDHKKIYAYDLQTGKQLWYNSDITFLFSYGDLVYASRDNASGIIFYEMNPLDGAIIREITDEEIDDIHSVAVNVQVEVRTFPETLHSDSQYYPEIRNINKIISNTDHYKELIEYIEMPKIFIVTYYTRSNTTTHPSDYHQEILILDRKDKQTIYQARMNSNTKALHPETYFVIDNYLYYIQEKTALIAIMLP